MATMNRADQVEGYKYCIQQIESLFNDESDPLPCMANMAAILKDTFNFWWVGFYLVKGNELVLGPFQGPVACTRIPFGKGVCGTAWKEQACIRVDDVHTFPGHIACSAASNSEIVVPLIHKGVFYGVLDIDSTDFNSFSEVDEKYLRHLCAMLALKFGENVSS
jgi:L-methionine (R)-S-oxide reductase